MENGDVVEVRELVRKYGDLTAVAGVSFEVHEGEIFGFLGPNGAGKSTTIGMLCTLLRPTSGHAEINGYDIVQNPAAVRKSIGLVFQDPSLDDRLTADENLEFHAVIYGVPSDVKEKRKEDVLKMVDLWDRRKSLVRTFSGGMKRRLEIARGLMHYPRVLFLDEPTLGLDPQTRSHIWKYVEELRHQEGISIFMTTHYMDEGERADRIAVIDHGEIIALDSPEGLKGLVGGDIITVRTADDEAAARQIEEQYHVKVRKSTDADNPCKGGICFEIPNGAEFIPSFVTSLKTQILAISLRRPTLEDVFLKLTGREIREEEASGIDQMRDQMRARGFGGRGR